MNVEDRLAELDRAHLIHPLTHPKHFERHPPRIVVEGEGVWIRDAQGRRYIDGFSGLWCVAVGHNHPKIVEAVHRQMKKLSYFTSFHGVATPPAIELAARIAGLLNPSYRLTRMWFTCGGTESNETNIKMARLYWALSGKPDKKKILSRRFSYHGMGLATTAATGIFPFHFNLDPLPEGFVQTAAPYCYQCEFERTYPGCGLECVRDVEETIRQEGPETVAAFLAEPVIGSGGVIPPPPDYFPAVRQLCDRYDILLILDEVITGFGRTGAMFAHEHWGGIRPDMLSLAKGLSSGHIPLGAAVMREDIYQAIGDLQDDRLPLMHGFTYMNHPVGCAAGLANLEVIEEEGLVRKAEENGRYLLEGLRTLSRHRSVGDVRGMGMLAAIEFVADREKKVPIKPENEAPEMVARLCWEKGLYIRSSTMETVCIAPALIMERPIIDRIVEILDSAIAEMERALLP